MCPAIGPTADNPAIVSNIRDGSFVGRSGVLHTELCLICGSGGTWSYWSDRGSVRGHHGSPAPANRPGGRTAGIFCQKIVDTCLRARTILRFLRCVRSTTGNAHCVWSRGKVSGHHHYAGPPLPVRYASNCTPACLQQPALRDALYRLS